MNALKDPNLSKEELRLLYGLQGIQRIVINTCHGGFGLSEAAVMRYLELSGTQVWVEKDPEESFFDHTQYWLIPPGPERAIYACDSEEWIKMPLVKRQANNALISQQMFSPRDIDRDDPYLVEVVEELGDAANGRHAELKVVDIPSDVEWEIAEYDGSEWVAEKHRTWS